MAIIKIRNTAIDLDAAEIPNLDASKITSGSFGTDRIPNLAASKITSGTFTDGRIAASNVSQHATSFDDNDIVNDLSTLAIRQASDGNRSAYNTNSQYIDVFQDSTGVTSLTNTSRSSDEYVSSVQYSTVAYSTLDPTYTKFGSFSTPSSAWHGTMTDASQTTGFGANGGSVDCGFVADFGANVIFNDGDLFIGTYRTNGDITQTKLQYSADNTTYSDIDFSGTSVAAVSATGSYSAPSGASGSIINFAGHSSNGHASIHKMTSVPTFTARYIKWTITAATFHDSAAYFSQLNFDNVQTGSTSATGSFESNAITAPSSVSSMGAIITYQDNAGTNTLNTDVILKLSADNGSNFSTATLTAMPDFATGIKMAKVNDLSVTAGTQLKYKLEFANQASGSKEARIRGVSLQY